MASRSSHRQPEFSLGQPQTGALRLGKDWRDVEVPVSTMAELLGCRPTHLRQNFGDALQPVRRGLFRLGSVENVAKRLLSRRNRHEVVTAEQSETLRLRNAKLQAEIERVRASTRAAIDRLRKSTEDEVLDGFMPLVHELRTAIGALGPDQVEIHNEFVRALARKIEERRRTLSEDETSPAGEAGPV